MNDFEAIDNGDGTYFLRVLTGRAEKWLQTVSGCKDVDGDKIRCSNLNYLNSCIRCIIEEGLTVEKEITLNDVEAAEANHRLFEIIGLVITGKKESGRKANLRDKRDSAHEIVRMKQSGENVPGFLMDWAKDMLSIDVAFNPGLRI